jgi:TPR repeat protein
VKIYLKKLRITYLLFVLAALTLSGCASRNASLDRAQNSYAARDYARAFKELWRPVEAHDPRAVYAMGYMYYYGIGTDKDQDLGRSFIRRAAASNYPPAVIALKRLTEGKHEQYLPFEKYSSAATTHDEGILEINKPLLRRRKV